MISAIILTILQGIATVIEASIFAAIIAMFLHDGFGVEFWFAFLPSLIVVSAILIGLEATPESTSDSK